MRLTHLSITNFKNYARLQLDLTPGTTVVTDGQLRLTPDARVEIRTGKTDQATQ